MQISAVNDTGRQAGIYTGMRLADAKALLPALRTKQAMPETNSKALADLANWCQRYTPIISVERKDGLWLDVTGATHFYGPGTKGEERLLKDLSRKLTGLGLQNQLGLAETPGAAWAMARFAPSRTLESRIIPPNHTKDFLHPLPIKALRLDENCIYMLKRFGLESIGDLYQLPPAALKRRFPSKKIEQAVLQRLGQALGHVYEPIVPLNPAPACYERMTCPEPILQTEGIWFALDTLLTQLCARMEKKGEGARALTFSAYHADGGVSQITITTARPSRNAAHLAHLFRNKLEQINPGFGIDLFQLSANHLEPLKMHQPALPSCAHTQQMEGDMASLIDRLANHLGVQNLHCLSFKESHIPERAEIRINPLQNPSFKLPDQSSASPSRPLRPFRLLASPEPIQVVAEGAPLHFTWRRIRHHVIRSEGPERIVPEWWLNMEKTLEPTRDYYRLEDSEGRRFWVFRKGLYEERSADETLFWYMHGVFA